MNEFVQQSHLDGMVRELCAFRTAAVADENAALFARIHRELPLEIFRFASSDSHLGWIVPDNWRVKKARLLRDGVPVFDGLSHTLAVGYYSKSFAGELDWEELRPHLVTNPAMPDAYMFHCMWQYRPWDADWCLCVPFSIFETLGPGRYCVELETEYSSGEMLVAHHHRAGRSEKTIVFNAHTCHPHMANDGFAGVVLLVRLMQWLRDRDTFYSYRLVLGPEHLGTVFYLRDRSADDVSRLVGGVFVEMPGTPGPLKATATFNGNHVLDRAMAHVLRHHARASTLVPWRKGAGNDETVWEAPGYEVPFVELTRCEDQFAPFREYHSSLDTPELMDPAQVDETLRVLERVVDVVENDCFVRRTFDGLVCLSNPAYDLYMERPDPAVTKKLEGDAEKWGHLLDCLFRYMDGDMTVLDIAERHDLPFDRLHRYLRRFEQKGLVKLTRAEIDRRLPLRVATVEGALLT